MDTALITFYPTASGPHTIAVRVKGRPGTPSKIEIVETIDCYTHNKVTVHLDQLLKFKTALESSIKYIQKDIE